MTTRIFISSVAFSLLISISLVSNANSQAGYFIGEWKGSTWCAEPAGQKKRFQFDIWTENNVIRCDDHSGMNRFKPCVLAGDGSLHCSWYRTGSNANGTYVFHIDSADANLMHGHESTHNAPCRQYGYELRREAKNPFVGKWTGSTWCAEPAGQKKRFQFDIWTESNVIRCDDHSGMNRFKPCVLAGDGSLHCSWYRTGSNANGTYVFHIDSADANLMHGHESTLNVPCKQYGYELRR